MYQRQRNPRAVSAHIPESRGLDGAVLAAVEVEAGAEIDWPFPLAGFEGWGAPEGAEPGADPDPAAAGSGAKSRTKATKTAPDTTPEVTA